MIGKVYNTLRKERKEPQVGQGLRRNWLTQPGNLPSQVGIGLPASAQGDSGHRE